MVELRVTRSDGAGSLLGEKMVEDFRTALRGELVLAGDAGYEDARKVWNGMIDKRPALISRCLGASDVITSVNFARDNNLLVAVRGGGHSFPGKSTCDGGIVIDLSRMKSVRVDPARGTARAEPGAKWIDFDRETQAFGLATTGGTVSDTGNAGLTLGGGLGWLMGHYGLTCDNLLSADLVTADGKFLTTSTAENPELFWGLRGGGGNFGVVTSFEYQLHTVGPVIGGMVSHPFHKFKEVFDFYRDFVAAAPNELIAAIALLTSPEGAPVVAILACYSGPLDVGEKVMKPLHEFGPPVADHLGPMPYSVTQTLMDEATLPGNRYYIRSDYTKELGDDAVHAMVERFQVVPSPQSGILFFPFGGAMRSPLRGETSYVHRDAGFDFEVIGEWQDSRDDEKNIGWTREVWEAMRPFTSGSVYVNGLGDEGDDRVREAYGAETYKRLVALKNKLDPGNLFRLNQNIVPTA